MELDRGLDLVNDLKPDQLLKIVFGSRSKATTIIFQIMHPALAFFDDGNQVVEGAEAIVIDMHIPSPRIREEFSLYDVHSPCDTYFTLLGNCLRGGNFLDLNILQTGMYIYWTTYPPLQGVRMSWCLDQKISSLNVLRGMHKVR